MASGAQTEIRYIAESTWGTTPGTPALVPIRHTACSLTVNKNVITSETIRSDRMVEDVIHADRIAQGDLECEYHITGLDALLESALQGAWTTNVLKAGSTRKSFTMQRRYTELSDKTYQVFTGVEVSKMEISCAPNQIAKVKFSLIGKGGAFSATAITGSTTPAGATTGFITTWNATLLEGGSSLGTAAELSISLDNGLEAQAVIGSVDTIQPSVKRSIVTGTLTAHFTSAALAEKFINGTESSISLQLSDGTNSHTILIPALKYTGAPIEVSGEGSIMVPLAFAAYYKASEATNLKITRTA